MGCFFGGNSCFFLRSPIHLYYIPNFMGGKYPATNFLQKLKTTLVPALLHDTHKSLVFKVSPLLFVPGGGWWYFSHHQFCPRSIFYFSLVTSVTLCCSSPGGSAPPFRLPIQTSPGASIFPGKSKLIACNHLTCRCIPFKQPNHVFSVSEGTVQTKADGTDNLIINKYSEKLQFFI